MKQLDMQRLVTVAEIVVKNVLECSKDIENMKGREGVAICIADHGGDVHALFRVLAPPSPEKGRKYVEMARKKAYDLSLLLLFDAMKTSIAIYKSDPLDRYPGAIVSSTWLIATSGHIGNLDEVVSLGIAVGLRDLTPEAALNIGAENPHQAILRRVLDVVRSYI